MLSQLAASGDDFTNAFHVFLTYPFVDEVVGRDPQVARNLHMGDYTNLSITLDMDLSAIPTDTPHRAPDRGVHPARASSRRTARCPTPAGCARTRSTRSTTASPACARGDATACLGLPPSVIAVVCDQFPDPRAVRHAAAARHPAADAQPADDPAADAALDHAAHAAPAGAVRHVATAIHGEVRTMGQLTERYDPALVSLLVPGMVTR